MDRFKKIAISLSAVLAVVTLLEIVPLQAHAQFAAVVSDPLVETNTTALVGSSGATAGTSATNAASTVGGWLAQATRFVIDNGLKVALAALKKRLIDTMTDEIITWINNGGSPQFIQNFSKDVFQPALQQAVGDTVQQILPSLCSPYAFKVNLELSAPQPLSQPSSCTLNSIVANFNDFRQNFNQGGIIGYTELLQPQNNQYGVDIIAQDALYNNVQQATAQNVLQAQVNVGFKSPQQCLNWVVVNNQNHQTLTTPKDIKNGNDSYNDPNNPPPMDYSTLSQTGADTHSRNFMDLSQLSWQCGDLQIATPGRVLATGLEKSLYANLDLAINDPDITNALAMIADAAFNRLIKAGVQGVQGIIRTATTGGGSTDNVTPEQVVTAAQDNTGNGSLGQAINNTTGLANQAASSTQNTYITQLNQALSSLADASTTLATASSTNQTLATSTLPALIKCLGSNASSSDLAWAQGNLTIAASSTPIVLRNTVVQTTSSTIATNALLNTIQNADASTLSQLNASDITNAVTNASSLDVSAQTTLSGIQTTLGTAQTKLTQCQANQ